MIDEYAINARTRARDILRFQPTLPSVMDILNKDTERRGLNIPGAGKHVVFSDKPIEGVNTIQYPTGQKVAFVGVNAGDIERVRVLLQRFAGHGNELFYFQTDGDPTKIDEIGAHIGQLKPDMVVMPHEADQRPEYMNTFSAVLEAIRGYDKGSNVIGVSYESAGIVPINRVTGFSTGLNGIKRMAEAAHESQMTRTPFDDITEMSNRALAIETNLGAQAQLAEGFVSFIAENGTLRLVGGGVTELDFKSIREEFYAALFVSPHPDDDLAADVTLRRLKSAGLEVVNLLLSLGYAAYIPGVDSIKQKAVLRLSESRKSGEVLGIEVKSIVPIYIPGQEGHTYEHIMEYRAGLEPKLEQEMGRLLNAAVEHEKKLLIFLPHPQDIHPSHSETYELVKDVIARLSPNGEIHGLFYASPWAGKFNAWNYYKDDEKPIPPTREGDAQKLREMSLAAVGGELVAGVGQPPAMGLGKAADKYGGSVERVNIFSPSEI